MKKLLNHFPLPPKVVVEATRNWMWLVASLKGKSCEVKLAHPLKTKAIASARIKTDSIDAKTLCHLLRGDLVPASYVASRSEQDHRELSRRRVNLVHFRTMMKNRIRAILGKENINCPYSDLFGKMGKEWLSKQSLSDTRRKMVNIYQERLIDLEKAAVSQKLNFSPVFLASGPPPLFCWQLKLAILRDSTLPNSLPAILVWYPDLINLVTISIMAELPN